MRSSFSYAILIAVLSQWRGSLTEGYLFPPQQLHLSRGFSQKISNASVFLNSAASDKLTNNSSDNYRQIRVEKRTEGIDVEKRKIMVGTLSLIKAMAGTGILALPSGVGGLSDYRTSIIPAIALMSALGIASTYTFILYGRLIHDTQAKSLGELWEKKMDKKSAWLVSAVSLTFCYGACLAYTLCLGDVTSSLAQTIGFNGICASRQFWIILLVTTTLYPLCNLRSLISLAPLSLAGVGSVLITGIFIAWRCPFVNRNSPYSTLGLGWLLKTLSPEQIPKFQTLNKGFLSPSSLILFGMAASAYLGHFTAPDLYHSLQEQEVDSDGENHGAVDDLQKHVNPPKGESSTLTSFYKISQRGFLSTIIINCFIMTFGFLTFGGNSMGVILNNFSTFDKGATICRLLTAVSIVGGFPFLIRACRSEMFELYNLKTNRKPTRKDEKMTTAMLLSSLALLAMIVSDAGMIIGLAGAVMGSALVYIFPSLLYLSTTQKVSKPKTKFLTLERVLCRFLVVFGTFAALAGAMTVAI